MIKLRNSLAGLLLLAFFAAVPVFGAVQAVAHGHPISTWLVLGFSALGVLGTVTVTYKYQNPLDVTLTSSITAPTALKASVINSIAAIVFMADTETTATLTHNWKLSTNALALLYPFIIWYWTTAGTGLISFALTDSSTVTITKNTGTGSGGTFNVILMKPHTIIGPSSD